MSNPALIKRVTLMWKHQGFLYHTVFEYDV